MDSCRRNFRVNDASIELGTGRDARFWPDYGIPNYRTGFDDGAGTDCRAFDHRPIGDVRLRVNQRGKCIVAVRLEVGITVAKVEPDTFVEDYRAEATGSGKFEKCRDDRDFFVGRNQIEKFRADAVNPGK